MDLSADCQRKWIVSLLSVPAFAPSSCLCLSPPSLTLLSAALSLLLSFNALSLSLSHSLSVRFLFWTFVSTSLSHLSLPQSSSFGLFVFTSFPPLLPGLDSSSCPDCSLSALVDPFVLPSSETYWLKAPAVQIAPLSLTSMGILQPSTIKYIHEKFPPSLHTHACMHCEYCIEILYVC